MRTISDCRSVAERILLSRFVVCLERICVDVALCHVDNLTMALDVKPRLKELKRALLRPKCRVCVPAFELGLEHLPVVAPDLTVHRGEAVGICIANQINRALSVDGTQRHSRVVTVRVGCIDPANGGSRYLRMTAPRLITSRSLALSLCVDAGIGARFSPKLV